MKKVYVIIMLILVSASYQVKAQENLISFQYSMGFTNGDFHDYISKPSFRGFAFDYRRMVKENIGVGFESGWNAFYEEKPYDTFTEGTVSLSGKQFRYGFTCPILASADYYLKPGELINPFIGIGIGTMFSRTDVDMGLYTFGDDVWHFALKPEIGVIIAPSYDIGIIIAGKYFNAFESGSSGSRNYFGLNVGIVWAY